MFTAAAALAAAPSAVAAQTLSPERPYRALFARGAAEPEQSLVVTASLASGYDDDVLDATSGNGKRLGSATYSQLTGGLVYGLQRTRIRLAASADSSLRYYPPLSDHVLAAHSAGIALSLKLARETRLLLSEAATYQPLLSLAAFPSFSERVVAERGALTLDGGQRRAEFLTHASAIDFSHQVSRRGVVSAAYGYRANRVGADGALTVHNANARYALSVSRYLTLRLGYGRSVAQYPVIADTVRSDNVDVGVSYTRALGPSRRTTVAFSTGAASVDNDRELRYRAIGDAQVRREIGRSWTASVGYRRDVQYVETFRTPVLADALTVSVAGEINRRVYFRSLINGAIANLTLGQPDDHFNTSAATVGVVVGLSRSLGLAADYSLYRYDFRAGATLPAGFSRELTRHGVMVGLNLWLPVVERPGRSDAAR